MMSESCGTHVQTLVKMTAAQTGYSLLQIREELNRQTEANSSGLLVARYPGTLGASKYGTQVLWYQEVWYRGA